MALYGSSIKAKLSHVLSVRPAGLSSDLVIKVSFSEFLCADFVKSKALPYTTLGITCIEIDQTLRKCS